MTQRANPVTGLVEQFRRERTGTYARTIGLENTIYLTNLVGSNTQTGTSTCTDRIRRSDKRIRTEINVQHCPLRTFAQYRLAGSQQIVHLVFAVHQLELFQVFDTFEPCLLHFCKVILIVQALQYLFMTGLGRCILLVKVMQNVAYTHTVTADFIRVSRSDTFSGRSYLCIAFGCFVCSIQYAVSRQNEVCFLGNVQAFLQVMAGRFQ